MGSGHSATQVDLRRPGLPQPLRAGLPWLLVALVLLAGASFGRDARYLIAAAAGCLVVGAVRALLELRDLWALRRAADAVLRTGARVHPYSTLLVWRAGELTSEHNRKLLSRSFRNIVRELERPSLMSAVPLDRRQARAQAGLLIALRDRLADLDSSISPRGVVLVEDLLTDGLNSPLFSAGYSPVDDRDDSRRKLGPVLEECLAALEPAGESPKSRSATGLPDTNPDVFDPDAAANGRVSAHGGGNR
jgi:hypothetical protein